MQSKPKKAAQTTAVLQQINFFALHLLPLHSHNVEHQHAAWKALDNTSMRIEFSYYLP